jgi:hypothetical protein
LVAAENAEEMAKMEMFSFRKFSFGKGAQKTTSPEYSFPGCK